MPESSQAIPSSKERERGRWSCPEWSTLPELLRWIDSRSAFSEGVPKQFKLYAWIKWSRMQAFSIQVQIWISRYFIGRPQREVQERWKCRWAGRHYGSLEYSERFSCCLTIIKLLGLQIALVLKVEHHEHPLHQPKPIPNTTVWIEEFQARNGWKL